ncbi:MAG: uL15 family ribosomal protein [Patescibacteria group bacterium]
MQLHSLSSIKQRKFQRVGRGGKRGTYSGRGLKGQKSRSGRKMRPAERDLIIRLPKKRGFHNKPKSPAARVIQLSAITKMTGTINLAALKKAGLLQNRFSGPVKILSAGEAPKNAVIHGLALSKDARKKVEAAGSTVE